MWICIPPSSLTLICNAVRCNNFIAQCDNFNAQCDNFIAHCDNFNAQCDTMHCNRTVHTDSWPTWTMQPNVFPAASSALHSTENFSLPIHSTHTLGQHQAHGPLLKPLFPTDQVQYGDGSPARSKNSSEHKYREGRCI